MIKNLEYLNSWLISRKKKNMTKTFKEASDDFRELMKKYNHKLVTTDGQILLDSDAEKYKEIERKDELKELAKKIITTDILEPKETENKNLNDYNKEIERIVKDIARISKEIAHDLELEFGEIESKDNIKSPKHYVSDSGIEVFEVQEAFIYDLKGMAASYWCNVVKYILRFQNKNGVEDLKKAKYYLEKLIDEEE